MIYTLLYLFVYIHIFKIFICSLYKTAQIEDDLSRQERPNVSGHIYIVINYFIVRAEGTVCPVGHTASLAHVIASPDDAPGEYVVYRQLS